MEIILDYSSPDISFDVDTTQDTYTWVHEDQVPAWDRSGATIFIKVPSTDLRFTQLPGWVPATVPSWDQSGVPLFQRMSWGKIGAALLEVKHPLGDST